MADFRTNIPEDIQPALVDTRNSRRIETPPGLARAAAGGFAQILQGVKNVQEIKKKKTFADFILELTKTDQLGKFLEEEGIQIQDGDEETLTRAAKKSKQLDSIDTQGGFERSGTTRRIETFRKFVAESPQFSVEFGELFRASTGRGASQAIRALEEEQDEPLDLLKKRIDISSAQFNLDPTLSRSERLLLLQPIFERQRKLQEALSIASLIGADETISTSTAIQGLRTEILPGLHDLVKIEFNRILGITDEEGVVVIGGPSIDPATLSAKDKLALDQGLQAFIEAKKTELFKDFPQASRTALEKEFELIDLQLATYKEYTSGDLTLAQLENANKIILSAATNTLLRDNPEIAAAAALSNVFNDFDAVLSAAEMIGVNEYFSGVLFGVIQGMSANKNTINALRNADLTVAQQAAVLRRNAILIRENFDNPRVAAKLLVQMLTAFTREFSEDPSLVPAELYEAMLPALVDPRVVALLDQVPVVGSQQLFVNIQQGFVDYVNRISRITAGQLQESLPDEIQVSPALPDVTLASFFFGKGFVRSKIPEIGRLGDTIKTEVFENGSIRFIARKGFEDNPFITKKLADLNKQHSDRLQQVAMVLSNFRMITPQKAAEILINQGYPQGVAELVEPKGDIFTALGLGSEEEVAAAAKIIFANSPELQAQFSEEEDFVVEALKELGRSGDSNVGK